VGSGWAVVRLFHAIKGETKEKSGKRQTRGMTRYLDQPARRATTAVDTTAKNSPFLCFWYTRPAILKYVNIVYLKSKKPARQLVLAHNFREAPAGKSVFLWLLSVK
jgi:hypothetical protein